MVIQINSINSNVPEQGVRENKMHFKNNFTKEREKNNTSMFQTRTDELIHRLNADKR